jgi:Protein of unknown function (DUF3108)
MAGLIVRRDRVRTVKASLVLGAVLLGSPLVGASVSMSSPSVTAPSFLSGERLKYDIRWAGLSVGEGLLESEPGESRNGHEVFLVRSTATSNKFLSFFFPVHDRVESIIDAKELVPYEIIVDQRHGLRRRYKVIRFDQDQHTALLVSKGKTHTYEVPPQVQDILSSLYYFRTLPRLEDGTSVFINVHESKKNWKLEIQILGRETLETALGTIPTIKAKAVIRFEGLLWDKGDLYLWLTDDERHIPVMMSGRIVIGSVTATLTQVEPPQLHPAP